jgi:long-chain acyl-CoA synthetase
MGSSRQEIAMRFAVDSDPGYPAAGRTSSPELAQVSEGAPSSHATGAGPFSDAFEAAALRFRDRTALRFRTATGWHEVSYASVRSEVRRVASWLSEQGVARGTTIALVSESRPEWVIAMFGVLESGATLVPIDPKLTAQEIKTLLGHAQPRFVLTSEAQHDKVANLSGEVPSVDAVFTIDAGADRSSLPTFRPRALRAPVSREPSEIALVVYTSGTTGNPKGVEITFGNLLFEARAVDTHFGDQGKQHFLSVLPLNHLFELVCGLLAPLLRGATVSYSDSLLPDDVVALLRGQKITSLSGVPLLFNALKRGIERNVKAKGESTQKKFALLMRIARYLPSYRLRRALFKPVLKLFAPSLRDCYCGGAALDPEVQTFFERMGIPMYPGYGLSEASPVISANCPRASRLGSVGRPFAGVEVRILKKDARDQVGEILTRGPHIMAGYRANTAATAEAINADGWLLTGDLGYLDDDGFLWVTGRSKDLVVLGGGKKVHPDEVEEAILRSPLFQEACVVGAPARSGMAAGFDEVCAVVVPGPDMLGAAAGDAAALEAAVHDELARMVEPVASFKRPTRIAVRSEALPRTVTRKVQRPLVREWLAKQS